MSIGKIIVIALEDMVLGMGTVFAVLILISLIIWLLGVVSTKAREKEEAEEAQAEIRKKEQREARERNLKGLAPAAAGEAKDGISPEVIAAIMAAISAYEEEEQAGQEPAGYVVKSIRRARRAV